MYAICVARFRLSSKACFWVVYMAELFTHWPLNARKAGFACLYESSNPDRGGGETLIILLLLRTYVCCISLEIRLK